MLKRTIHSTPSLVFRRWSRKAWAVQAAMGKQIRIGCVSVDICNAAYNKSVRSGAAVSLLLAGRAAILSDDEAVDDDTPPDIALVGKQCVAMLQYCNFLFQQKANKHKVNLCTMTMYFLSA